ncbi:MAG: extracellular matrix regulator RemB [Thermotaleaceae bacterium]
MFLHLGGDVVIPVRDIIAIMDMGAMMKSKDDKEFLKNAEKEGLIYKIYGDEPKSCVLAERASCRKKDLNRSNQRIIYYSPISSTTLQKRAGFMDEMHI